MAASSVVSLDTFSKESDLTHQLTMSSSNDSRKKKSGTKKLMSNSKKMKKNLLSYKGKWYKSNLENTLSNTGTSEGDNELGDKLDFLNVSKGATATESTRLSKKDYKKKRNYSVKSLFRKKAEKTKNASNSSREEITLERVSEENLAKSGPDSLNDRTHIVSDWAREKGTEAYRAMLEADRLGDVCLMEKCYVLIGEGGASLRCL